MDISINEIRDTNEGKIMNKTTEVLNVTEELSKNGGNQFPVQKGNTSELEPNELDLRNEIISDFEKMQLFQSLSIIYFLKVGKKLIEIKEKLDSNRFIIFLASLNVSKRTAERYTQIAKHDRFSSLTEEQIKSAVPLSQSKMLKMIKLNDEKFQQALNDPLYDFKSKSNDNNKTENEEESDEEKEKSIRTTFINGGYSNLTFEQYKLYSDMKIEQLIKIIDDDLSRLKEMDNISKLYTPIVQKEKVEETV